MVVLAIWVAPPTKKGRLAAVFQAIHKETLIVNRQKQLTAKVSDRNDNPRNPWMRLAKIFHKASITQQPMNRNRTNRINRIEAQPRLYT